MKKKFELKCNKIKGISFHKTRQNWVAIGLFTGEVQIWDFRNGFKIAEFKDSEVCIRSIDFHPLQCLLVAAGDDFTIRGYDYSENKKAFELKGHVDFVRTVQFHNELPWLLSCSDDQTLRIWNWQSKTQLSVITGHSHYVMCARFHPSKDLIGSGSLDSNLRIWDFSKLKSRFSSSHGTVYMLSNDVEATVVAETHTKGINWIEFHPTEDLVATCSDDKLVKVWKFTTSGAYEEIGLHGHASNVSSVLFTPDGKHLISNSEDFQVRYWDLKTGLCLQKFTVGEERQWALAMHPELPLVATGGDKSLVILSLNSEKVQFDANKYGVLVYFSPKDLILKAFILSTGATMNLNSPNKLRSNDTSERKLARSLFLNPFSQGLAVSGTVNMVISGQVVCHIFNGIIGESISITPNKAKQAVFLSNEKVLMLDDELKLRLIKLQGLSLLNDFEVPFDVNAVFQGTAGKAFLQSGNRITFFDFLAKREMFTIEDEDFLEIKRVQWSNNKTYFVIVTKFSIHLFDKKGKKKCAKKEESKIKSTVWGPENVLFYNTHEHIKFVLRDGEIGLVRSINKIMFLSFYLNKKLIAFDINENFEEIELDMTEIEFKNAFLKKSTDDLKELLKQKSFLGKSMVSYLLNKKFNSIALQLTTDKETAFNLAFYSKNFMRAFELAKELNNPKYFDLLGNECLSFGIDDLAEQCFNLSDNKTKLLSLFSLKGSFAKIEQLKFEDTGSLFNKSLMSGNVEERIRILAETGQIYLAYSTALTYGFSDYARRFEQAYPEVKDKIKLSVGAKMNQGLVGLSPVNRTCKNLLMNTVESDDVRAAIEEDQDENTGVQLVSFGIPKEIEKTAGHDLAKPKPSESGLGKNENALVTSGLEVNPDEAEEAWGVDDEDVLNELQMEETGAPVRIDESTKRTDLFFKEEDPLKSKIKQTTSQANELFAIGEIEAGIKLLANQVGLKSISPLKTQVTELAAFNKCYSSIGMTGNTFFVNQLVKPNNRIHNRFNFEYFKTKFEAVLNLVTKAKLAEAIEQLNSINCLSILVWPNSLAEAETIQFLKLKTLHYSIALRAKLLSDKTADPKRKIELLLAMVCCELDPVHRLLILQLSINALVKLENYLHALILVRKYLKVCQENQNVAKDENILKMKKLETVCEQKGKNQHEFIFREKYLYESSILEKIDFENLIFYFPENVTENQLARCLFDGSVYSVSRKGGLCVFCEMCEIGFDQVQYSVVENFKRSLNK